MSKYFYYLSLDIGEIPVFCCFSNNKIVKDWYIFQDRVLDYYYKEIKEDYEKNILLYRKFIRNGIDIL